MVKKFLVSFVLFLTIVGSAEPWRQQGENWSQGVVSLTIPASLKPQCDSRNVLEAEGRGVSLTFQLLSEKEDFKTFFTGATKQLQGFKGIQWSAPQYGQEGDLQMTLRVGSFKAKEASLEFGLSLFQKGQVKLATMTVQRSGDSVASRLIGQMMNSIQFR